MSSTCLQRLRKEHRELIKKPVENIRAAPLETNLLEWHYVIEGPKGSPYEGGYYHGVVTFPRDYPYKPPSLQMLTPNGRFKPSTRLCLSMSDFHPETWNPLWSVGTVLLGLYSFMLEETPTYGSIVTTDLLKRQLANESLEYNVKNKIFCELFPDLVTLCEERRKTQGLVGEKAAGNGAETKVSSPEAVAGSTSWTAILALFAAIVACTWAILALSV
eukprot:gene2615-2858_t